MHTPSSGQLVEVQSTAEGTAIGREAFDTMLQAALDSIASLCELQEKALNDAGVDLGVLTKRL